jgi:hypothetical protein
MRRRRLTPKRVDQASSLCRSNCPSPGHIAGVAIYLGCKFRRKIARRNQADEQREQGITRDQEGTRQPRENRSGHERDQRCSRKQSERAGLDKPVEIVRPEPWATATAVTASRVTGNKAALMRPPLRRSRSAQARKPRLIEPTTKYRENLHVSFWGSRDCAPRSKVAARPQGDEAHLGELIGATPSISVSLTQRGTSRRAARLPGRTRMRVRRLPDTRDASSRADRG